MIMITEQDLESIRRAKDIAAESYDSGSISISVILGFVLANAASLQKERPNPEPQIAALPGPTMEEVMATFKRSDV